MIKPLTSDGGMHPNIHDCMDKINDLIDAVNKMQTMFDAYTTRFRQLDAESKKKIVNGFKNSQDPYAEQRKWIGKLCKFWDDKDDEYEDYIYEILIDIEDDGSDYPYKIVETYPKNRTRSYKHCKPVSEDLIYKGSDNE